jgi:hypothetical protein
VVCGVSGGGSCVVRRFLCRAAGPGYCGGRVLGRIAAGSWPGRCRLGSGARNITGARDYNKVWGSRELVAGKITVAAVSLL